jgi:hypothetical protein
MSHMWETCTLNNFKPPVIEKRLRTIDWGTQEMIYYWLILHRFLDRVYSYSYNPTHLRFCTGEPSRPRNTTGNSSKKGVSP